MTVWLAIIQSKQIPDTSQNQLKIPFGLNAETQSDILLNL